MFFPQRLSDVFYSLVNIDVVRDGETLFSIEPPEINSVKNTRPLACIIGEEDNPLIVNMLYSKFDEQAVQLLSTTMEIKDSEGKVIMEAKHKMCFLCADEKHRRDLLGMAKSGSRWVCTLCDAQTDDLMDINKFGSWSTDEMKIEELTNRFNT